MRVLLPALWLGCALLTLNCTEAQSKKEKKGKKKNKTESAYAGSVPGLVKLATLPAGVRESSGLAHAAETGTYFTHADGGNEAILFTINRQGKLLGRLKVPARNHDWESLAQDRAGNLFIADCGNNDNNRKNLAIYKLNPASPAKAETINFQYADQKDFPPKKKQRNFDCEASLWHQGNLYLFTRDRGSKQTSNVYTLPASPGNHTAKRIASLRLGAEVTGADLSPNGKTLALVGKEKLFVFEGSSFQEALKASPRHINLPGTGQTEGVLFLTDNTLLISSEEGVLYEFAL